MSERSGRGAEPRPGRTRVLVAGTFDPAASRNRVILGLLERSGIDVDVVHVPMWGSHRYSLVDSPKPKLLAGLARAEATLAARLVRAPRPDVVLALYPGWFDTPLLRLAAWRWRVPLVFDPFISLHETISGDRALRSERSMLARTADLADKVACRVADVVLADTPQHADFLSAQTGARRNSFRVLWVGADESLFHPLPGVTPEDDLVLFYGTYIPLHGIETIVRAADRVGPRVRFRLIGEGQERPRVEALIASLGVKNIELVPTVPIDSLPDEIARAAVCLGIFGTTPKADRVVPTKLFEYLAVGRPVITADTTAIRSVFAPGELELTPPGDDEALADAIVGLLEDPSRREAIGERGHRRYQETFASGPLASLLREHLVNAD